MIKNRKKRFLRTEITNDDVLFDWFGSTWNIKYSLNVIKCINLMVLIFIVLCNIRHYAPLSYMVVIKMVNLFLVTIRLFTYDCVLPIMYLAILSLFGKPNQISKHILVSMCVSHLINFPSYNITTTINCTFPLKLEIFWLLDNFYYYFYDYTIL